MIISTNKAFNKASSTYRNLVTKYLVCLTHRYAARNPFLENTIMQNDSRELEDVLKAIFENATLSRNELDRWRNRRVDAHPHSCINIVIGNPKLSSIVFVCFFRPNSSFLRSQEPAKKVKNACNNDVETFSKVQASGGEGITSATIFHPNQGRVSIFRCYPEHDNGIAHLVSY